MSPTILRVRGFRFYFFSREEPSDASIRAITDVQLPSLHHLYWPDLDIDLAVESIEHPQKYPLVSRAQPKKALQPARRVRKKAKSKARSRAARG